MDLSRFFPNVYDALYRRVSVADSTSLTAPIAAWQFYGPGRVAEIKLANGLSCTYLNNARTNSMVQDPSPTNPGWGDQSSDRLGYDGAMRSIAKRYLSSELDEDNGYSDTTAVVGFTAAFDRASNKAYERELHAQSRSHLYLPIDEDGDVSLGYDSANRLRQYQRGTLASTGGIDGAGGGSVSTAITLPATEQSKTYVLDGLGNWKSTAYTQVNSGGGGTTAYNQSRCHNYVNQITSTTTVNGGTATVSFSYDHGDNTGGVKGNGNLANDGVRTYQYDAFNRLIMVGDAETSDTIATYTYDAMGRRIRKVIADLGSGLGGLTGDIPAGTTDYLYDSQQIIEDRDGDNTAVAQYVWGMYIDELLQMKDLAGSADYYLLSDLLYRATALTDDDGNIVEAYDTDAYGNTIIFDAPGTGSNWWADDASVTNDPVNAYIFTGRQYDPESQIYYYRARYYQPQLGRFISRDPIGYEASLNLYEYVTGNPIEFVDATGKCVTISGTNISINCGVSIPLVGSLTVTGSGSYSVGIVNVPQKKCTNPLTAPKISFPWAFSWSGRFAQISVQVTESTCTGSVGVRISFPNWYTFAYGETASVGATYKYWTGSCCQQVSLNLTYSSQITLNGISGAIAVAGLIAAPEIELPAIGAADAAQLLYILGQAVAAIA